MDRLARNLNDLGKIVLDLTHKGVLVRQRASHIIRIGVWLARLTIRRGDLWRLNTRVIKVRRVTGVPILIDRKTAFYPFRRHISITFRADRIEGSVLVVPMMKIVVPHFGHGAASVRGLRRNEPSRRSARVSESWTRLPAFTFLTIRDSC